VRRSRQKHRSLTVAALFSLVVLAQDQPARIGEIEFFGYSGIDLAAVRSALPIHEGDTLELSDETVGKVLAQIKDAVHHVTGHDPTDIDPVCCDDKGQWMIYIGLGGNSTGRFRYNAAPSGSARLSLDGLALYRQAMDANMEAVRKGKAGEDDSKGYSLSEEPGYRAKQLAMRDYALRHETAIRRVLESSSEVEQRRAAAELLGYARQSKHQIAALVRATRDPDSGVRNNALRALWVLARSNSRTATQIPAADFIAMLSSGSWSDRNKSGLLLERLTVSRDPKLLDELRVEALQALLEMARWRSPGHSYPFKIMLGRIAGIDEKRLEEVVEKGQDRIIFEVIERR
jgi:hypothetical protein